MSPKEALVLAEAEGLDLVEVAPHLKPPVCRIMDYGKFKYQQSKKAHASKKKKPQGSPQLKEVKVRPMTEEHDLQFKLRHIKRFLQERNKAKISLIFRGREIIRAEMGKTLLDRIAEEVKEIGIVEQEPRLEGRSMTMVIAPKS